MHLRCLKCDGAARDENGDVIAATADDDENDAVAAGGGQSGDDLCNICWTDELTAAPCVRLACGHLFHYHCARDQLSKKWPSPCISFQFADCKKNFCF